MKFTFIFLGALGYSFSLFAMMPLVPRNHPNGSPKPVQNSDSSKKSHKEEIKKALIRLRDSTQTVVDRQTIDSLLALLEKGYNPMILQNIRDRLQTMKKIRVNGYAISLHEFIQTIEKMIDEDLKKLEQHDGMFWN